MNRIRRSAPLPALCALAAIPYVLAAIRRHVDYDGYWNVFMATEGPPGIFVRQIAGDTHPPLFLVLLRIACAFGRSRIVYRSVSLAAAIGCVFLMGRIARDLGARRSVALLAAAVFAFSMNTVAIATEVRSYMLATLFVLLTYAFVRRLLAGGDPEASARDVAAAAMFGTLALLADYSSAFFLSAAVLLVVATAYRRPERRRPLAHAIHRSRAAVALLVLTAAGMTAVFAVRANRLGGTLVYLSPFLHRPGPESWGAFLRRAGGAEIALFVPDVARANGPWRVLLLAAVAGFVGTALLRRRRAGPTSHAAWSPAALLALLGAGLAAASLAGIYPFGGTLRHQYVVFPFLVLAAAVAVDAATSRLASGWRSAVTAVLAFAVAANFVRGFREVRPQPGELFSASHAAFRSAFPDPPLVYAAQYSGIAFFTEYDRWKWSYESAVPGNRRMALYRISRPGRSFLFVRDNSRWNVDFEDPKLYDDLRRTLRFAKVSTITIFDVGRAGDRSLPRIDDRRTGDVRRHAASAKLEVVAARSGPLHTFVQLSDAR